MNTRKNLIRKYNSQDLNSLSYFELKKYNGGGWITEGIAFLRGLFGRFNERLEEMSAERKAEIIEEHGLRDHY